METRTGSVLVVDDEAGMRLSLEALLEERFTVSVAASVKEAKARLEVSGVDVLVSDYQLPDGTGLELFQWASTRNAPMMAILISGQPDHPELRSAEGKEQQIVRVLAKPFDPSRLIGLVARTVQLVRLRESMNALSGSSRRRAAGPKNGEG